MLSRILSRQGAHTAKRRWRPVLGALTVVAAIVGIFLLLPDPGPRLRPVNLSDEELRALTAGLRLDPQVAMTRPDRDLAAFGRLLFNDHALSPLPNLACANCHPAATGFSQDTPEPSTGAWRTLSVVNSRFSDWYGWDGRADSLAAQALDALEDPERMGSSRLFVADQIRGRLRAPYEAAFGPLPEAIAPPVPLPDNGSPLTPDLKLTVAVAAQGLASLGSWPLLEKILNESTPAHLAPAMELSRRAFARRPVPAAWTRDFAALSAEQAAAVNQLFANIGKALAAYETGLVAVESPFDHFAARLAAGRSSREAMDQGFGEAELAGLKLFVGPGHCVACHSGPAFADQQFHNLGLAQLGDKIAAGRAAGVVRVLNDPFNCLGSFLRPLPGHESNSCKQLSSLSPDQPALLGAYKTPSLRNSAGLHRFMHDGRFQSLAQVLDFYNELSDRPAIGSRDPALQALGFTKEELAALSSFLAALTSPVRDLNASDLAGIGP